MQTLACRQNIIRGKKPPSRSVLNLNRKELEVCLLISALFGRSCPVALSFAEKNGHCDTYC